MYADKVERRLRPVYDAIDCHQYKVLEGAGVGHAPYRRACPPQPEPCHAPHLSRHPPFPTCTCPAQNAVKMADAAQKKVGSNQVVTVLKAYSLIKLEQAGEACKVRFWDPDWSRAACRLALRRPLSSPPGWQPFPPLPLWPHSCWMASWRRGPRAPASWACWHTASRTWTGAGPGGG